MEKQHLKSFLSENRQSLESRVLPGIDEIDCSLCAVSAKNLTLQNTNIVHMDTPLAYEQYVELAIDIFQAQDRASINFLKDFLTVLPTEKCVEQVLLAAVYRLAAIDINSCRWVLSNSDYLQPELDLVKFAVIFVLTKLQNQKLIPGQDFKFETRSRLLVNEKALTQLMAGNSVWERLLLEEIIQVCNLT